MTKQREHDLQLVLNAEVKRKMKDKVREDIMRDEVSKGHGCAYNLAKGLAKEEELKHEIDLMHAGDVRRNRLEAELKTVQASNYELMERNQDMLGVLTVGVLEKLKACYIDFEIREQIEAGSGPLCELAEGLLQEDSLKKQSSNMPVSDP